jgi:hypothetical protein
MILTDTPSVTLIQRTFQRELHPDQDQHTLIPPLKAIHIAQMILDLKVCCMDLKVK